MRHWENLMMKKPQCSFEKHTPPPTLPLSVTFLYEALQMNSRKIIFLSLNMEDCSNWFNLLQESSSLLMFGMTKTDNKDRCVYLNCWRSKLVFCKFIPNSHNVSYHFKWQKRQIQQNKYIGIDFQGPRILKPVKKCLIGVFALCNLNISYLSFNLHFIYYRTVIVYPINLYCFQYLFHLFG